MVYIQRLEILHLSDMQYILRQDARYFLEEKLHIHGLFSC